MTVALEHRADLTAALAELGTAEVVIRNGGQHWTITVDQLALEWWPSSGRVVFGRKYNRPRKAHDHEQLMRLIRSRIPK